MTALKLNIEPADFIGMLKDTLDGISITPKKWDEWSGDCTMSEDQMAALDEAKNTLAEAISKITENQS